MKEFKCAVVQISAKGNKDENLKRAERMIKEAAHKGADLVVLPEMWNCPYRNDYFIKFAEEKEGKSYEFMKKIAKEEDIILIGGSIPIKAGLEKAYNESFIFDRNGREIYSYRKTNLFDVNIEGKVNFKESKNIVAGNKLDVFDTEFGKLGIVICYDLRFPELFEKMKKSGAKVFFIPGTFTVATGEKHWELLLRARAVDYQSFVVGASIARDEELSKNAYGHSMIINPMGEQIVSLGEGEGIIITNIDLKEVEDIRKSIPIDESRKNREI